MFNRKVGAYVLSRKADSKRVIDAFAQRIGEGGALVCNNLIQSNYVVESAMNADFIVVVGQNVTRTLRSGSKQYDFSKIKGFALLKRNRSELYIDLICGNGQGRIIFAKINEHAQYLGIKYIKLSAIPEAMMRYYNAYGFRFTETCTELDEVSKAADMLKKSSDSVKRALKQINSSAKMKKLKADEKKRDNLLQRLLASKNIVHDKGCKHPRDCAVSGYSMTKCL
jgi:hypothetical protein